ncbi:sn-glycerol-3-phosphate import ATP-binding protein UgpC [Aliidongia dinghuensis]|uniref:sn-glycerol-3-phosphate import ATP-binding protein UgpC n=1 Tax=Aliidongia dinghuensis TaxID=1867774 RepID=A0A8J3E2Q7_9PROT|nr:sn-glycerol-3-phosphate import ATP-binding protein UgpC [Aliidongia dinghuensis]GGF23459.1 sn-glycerol-3-phosphate import ATP-binding protein UgpC [Aliidongia dinghuensis]
MATVTLSAVTKSYAGNPVIHGIDCAIADGEFIVIVGPSGCGKSTLLRMVAGLEAITGGTIAIGDRVVNRVEPKDRDIAMVFQNYALYPHMTVFENMAYGLRIRGLSKHEIRTRVDRTAEILQLGQLLERTPRQLSGGQRQRVAMGRAIVREPQVFLFDEPLSNLDAKLRVQMRVEIKRLQQRLGTTSIYVTHDQVEAMTLADRLIVLNAGVAEQIGRPIELYERPASLFVAGFIGSPAMNFLEATVGEGGRITLTGGTVLTGPVAVPTGIDVTLGVRPEHLVLATDGEAMAHLHVEMVELLGADTVVYGTLGAGGPALMLRLNGIATVASGERLPLGFPPDRLHLFDRQSGRRL